MISASTMRAPGTAAAASMSPAATGTPEQARAVQGTVRFRMARTPGRSRTHGQRAAHVLVPIAAEHIAHEFELACLVGRELDDGFATGDDVRAQVEVGQAE